MSCRDNRPALAGQQEVYGEKIRLVVVSGLSGAGKSVALHTLEDLGYYCNDNLPANLLPAFVAEMTAPSRRFGDNIAVGIDARNPVEVLRELPSIVRGLVDDKLQCDLIFLEADDDILIKRFSETRRKHPLTVQERSLTEAIAEERKILEPLAAGAHISIDTSHTNLHQLREIVRQRVGLQSQEYLSLLIQSFGFKHGVPANVDFVFDVRCLPNPHWDPKLRPLTGSDPEVVSFLEQSPKVDEMYRDLEQFLERWIPCFRAENRSYLTIAIGCTGGQHRSVYLAERLARHFQERLGDTVIARHRELP